MAKNLEGDDLGISITFILFYLKIWSRLNINISLRKDFACSLIRCEPYQTSITPKLIKFGSRDCICQAAIGILESTVLFVLDITLWVCLHQISLALSEVVALISSPVNITRSLQFIPRSCFSPWSNHFKAHVCCLAESKREMGHCVCFRAALIFSFLTTVHSGNYSSF